MAETLTFAVAGLICVVGALGVVVARNPVHSALFLVQTLFGVAVLFIAKEAYFLAAIQVIVYAGAIVILFLFVIMLVGVDKAEKLEIEPVVGIRPVAVVIGAALFAALVTVILGVQDATGVGILPMDPERFDVEQLGDRLFTDWVFAVELTGLLLTIAVVGAVLLARRPQGELQELPDPAPMIVEYQAALAAAEAAESESASSGSAGGGDQSESTESESSSTTDESGSSGSAGGGDQSESTENESGSSGSAGGG